MRSTPEPPFGGELTQKVCSRCQRIVSCWPQAQGEEPERCPTCSGELEPWAAKVWFEPRPDTVMGGDTEERCEGPCPKCGTKITKDDMGLTVGLWD
jgi:hypothetical protein